MRKLSNAVDRFAYNHPRFGIPNLMLVVVAGNVLVYLLDLFSNASASYFLTFDLAHLLQGEVWRLVTFVFVPFTTRPFSLLIMLSFYYFVGNTLERSWGTTKFTLYYLSGMVLSVLGTILAAVITGYTGIPLANAHDINLTLFLAFAALYPDAQILLYFIIPLKAKWIAWVDCALIAWGFISSLAIGNVPGWLMPLVAMLNFLVFFWPQLSGFVNVRRRRAQHQTSAQTIHFKSAVKQQEKKARQQGYHHKCDVCGRTDADFPDLQFRYCSRCAGYHCYCQDHIFNHVHFTDES